MSRLIEEGLPAVRGYPATQGSASYDENGMRARAEELATGLVAAWLSQEVGAFDAFVAELDALNEFGEGTKMALGLLADIANNGLVGLVPIGQEVRVNPGILQDPDTLERLRLWAKNTPGDSPELGVPHRWDDALEIATRALTGRVTGFLVPYAAALKQFGAATPGQQRDVLLVLTLVVAQRFEKFADWQGQGFDCLNNYRQRQSPPESTAGLQPASEKSAAD